MQKSQDEHTKLLKKIKSLESEIETIDNDSIDLKKVRLQALMKIEL